MSNTIKIDEPSMAEIRMLQSRYNETISKLGYLQIEKMELDRMVNEFVEKEKKLKEDWAGLQTMERNVLDKLVKTYGTGNLNMSDGTFVPTETPPVTK